MLLKVLIYNELSFKYLYQNDDHYCRKVQTVISKGGEPLTGAAEWVVEETAVTALPGCNTKHCPL